MTSKFRIRKRRKTRGAAMVEAAVVMPVIVMFFGLITFAYRDLAVAQEVMLLSRHNAFRNSLQSCRSQSQDTGGSFSDQVARTSEVGGDKGQAAISQEQLKSVLQQIVPATSMSASKLATNSPLSTVTRSRLRTSTSYVYCNPAGFYLGDFIDRMTGLAKRLLGMAN